MKHDPTEITHPDRTVSPLSSKISSQIDQGSTASRSEQQGVGKPSASGTMDLKKDETIRSGSGGSWSDGLGKAESMSKPPTEQPDAENSSHVSVSNETNQSAPAPKPEVMKKSQTTTTSTSPVSSDVSAMSRELNSLMKKQESAHYKLRTAKARFGSSEARLTQLQDEKLQKDNLHKRLIEEWKLAVLRKKENRTKVDNLTHGIELMQQGRSARHGAERKAEEEAENLDQKVAVAEQKLAVLRKADSLKKQWNDPVDHELARGLGWGGGAGETSMKSIVRSLEKGERGLDLNDMGLIMKQLSRVEEKVKPGAQSNAMMISEADDNDSDDTEQVSAAAL